MEKTCSKCGEVKDVSLFGKRNNSKDGLTGQCKTCLNEKHEKYRDTNHEAATESSRDWARRNRERNAIAVKKWRKVNPLSVALQNSRTEATKHGHMPCSATVQELRIAYDGRCAICGCLEMECPKRLHMDHDHKTGKFRGFLCIRCNNLLGLAQDDENILAGAISYLGS